MSRKSASIHPLGEVGYIKCVVCHYCNNNYLVTTIVNHWRYCKAYISQCLGDDETKNVEEQKKKGAERTNRYHQSKHGKQKWRMYGYKKEFMNSNPEETFKYYISNIVANGWLNIKYDDYPLYWVKVKISLSANVFNNIVQNWLIMYLEGQKRNLSIRISELKEAWTVINFKAIWSIFHPNQLHSSCHLPIEVVE